MKKKSLKVAALVLTMLLTLAMFVGCGEKAPDTKGSCTIVVGSASEKAYTAPLDKVTGTNGLISVLDYLKEAEGLTYTSNDSGYGAYLTQVDDIKEDAENGTYLYIWTSVAADFDVSEYATQKTYGDKTLTSSGVGATQMTIEDGAVIYIGTITY